MMKLNFLTSGFYKFATVISVISAFGVNAFSIPTKQMTKPLSFKDNIQNQSISKKLSSQEDQEDSSSIQSPFEISAIFSPEEYIYTDVAVGFVCHPQRIPNAQERDDCQASIKSEIKKFWAPNLNGSIPDYHFAFTKFMFGGLCGQDQDSYSMFGCFNVMVGILNQILAGYGNRHIEVVNEQQLAELTRHVQSLSLLTARAQKELTELIQVAESRLQKPAEDQTPQQILKSGLNTLTKADFEKIRAVFRVNDK